MTDRATDPAIDSAIEPPPLPGDPFAAYAALRRDAPVFHDAARAIWIVSRYQDVAAVLRSPKVFSAGTLGADSFDLRCPDSGKILPQRETLLASDPPIHTGLRRFVAPFVSAERAERIEPAVQDIVRALVGRCADGRGGAGAAFDVIADLCAPTAIAVMVQILGLPPSRRPDVARWMQICARCNGQSRPPELRAIFDDMAREIDATARGLPTATATATATDGLLACLAAAAARGDIAPAQVVDICVTLLKGSAETIGHLVGNALWVLGSHPRLAAALRAHPDRIGPFIHESLRHDAPVQMTVRETTEAVVLSGVAIPPGARLLLLIGSANRDEAAFERAGQFDPDRARCRHLAFGAGPHQCPGAPLALVEARLILTALIERSDLAIDLASFTPTGVSALRGPQRLMARFVTSRTNKKKPGV